MDNRMTDPLKCEKSSCKPVEIPTDNEVEALDRLREIKKRVREIKKDLSMMPSEDSFYEKRLEAENELRRLKTEWDQWMKKRDKAARERMIALGHLEPDHH